MHISRELHILCCGCRTMGFNILDQCRATFSASRPELFFPGSLWHKILSILSFFHNFEEKAKGGVFCGHLLNFLASFQGAAGTQVALHCSTLKIFYVIQNWVEFFWRSLNLINAPDCPVPLSLYLVGSSTITLFYTFVFEICPRISSWRKSSWNCTSRKRLASVRERIN